MRIDNRVYNCILILSTLARLGRTTSKQLEKLLGCKRGLVEQLTRELKEAELIIAVHGIGGGYQLEYDPDDILLTDIIKAAGKRQRHAPPTMKPGTYSTLTRRIEFFLQPVTLAEIIKGTVRR